MIPKNTATGSEVADRFPINIASWALIISIIAFGFSCWSIQRLPASDSDLNELALVLTTVEILLVIFALFGFWAYKGVVEQQARSIAEVETNKQVKEFMEIHSQRIIRECLDDAELVAQLQSQFVELMIDDSEDADIVDDDPDWEP